MVKGSLGMLAKNRSRFDISWAADQLEAVPAVKVALRERGWLERYLALANEAELAWGFPKFGIATYDQGESFWFCYGDWTNTFTDGTIESAWKAMQQQAKKDEINLC